MNAAKTSSASWASRCAPSATFSRRRVRSTSLSSVSTTGTGRSPRGARGARNPIGDAVFRSMMGPPTSLDTAPPTGSLPPVDTGATIRLQLTLQYDGSGFHGWQFQPDQRTVQGDLESALSRLADRPRTVVGAGRTDAGVHASGQVASVDMPARWTPEPLQRALNSILPPDVWVQAVRRVRGDIHPRYAALTRTYVYRVGTHPHARSPFHRRWCWALGETLDARLLARAAACLPGAHSFLAFAKAGQPERGDRCLVAGALWEDWELGARFTITADRYLHHMVRYLVGTMVDVARGRRAVEDMERLLGPEPGLETSPPAPPEGLFLARVEYPDDVLVPDTPTEHPANREAGSMTTP
ncbi:MAG: tRNA pseudouridine(38-40) synthase TruA [Gemmatimonadetes bacterium]|nr:tRNA pseudouridine(38-40) synthase TruA [Gemmatimonadota bacterium]